MKNKNHVRNLILYVFISLLAGVFAGCEERVSIEDTYKGTVKAAKTPKSVIDNDFAVEAPPLTIFPCSDCHADQKPNPMRRKLVDMHDDIDTIFNHDSENRWCLDCHDLNNRDSLRLANGRLIGFDESYKLCGQCHGDKLRDWKVGVHGKRTGEWNGKKHYLLCVHCHNPHSPRFKPIKPLPPPIRQEDIKL